MLSNFIHRCSQGRYCYFIYDDSKKIHLYRSQTHFRPFFPTKIWQSHNFQTLFVYCTQKSDIKAKSTFPTSKRPQERVVFPDNIIVNIFRQFDNFFIFLWGNWRITSLFRGSGIVFGESENFPVSVRFSDCCCGCHFMFITWHLVNIRRFCLVAILSSYTTEDTHGRFLTQKHSDNTNNTLPIRYSRNSRSFDHGAKPAAAIDKDAHAVLQETRFPADRPLCVGHQLNLSSMVATIFGFTIKVALKSAYLPVKFK